MTPDLAYIIVATHDMRRSPFAPPQADGAPCTCACCGSPVGAGCWSSYDMPMYHGYWCDFCFDVMRAMAMACDTGGLVPRDAQLRDRTAPAYI